MLHDASTLGCNHYLVPYIERLRVTMYSVDSLIDRHKLEPACKSQIPPWNSGFFILLNIIRILLQKKSSNIDHYDCLILFILNLQPSTELDLVT